MDIKLKHILELQRFKTGSSLKAEAPIEIIFLQSNLLKEKDIIGVSIS